MDDKKATHESFTLDVVYGTFCYWKPNKRDRPSERKEKDIHESRKLVL